MFFRTICVCWHISKDRPQLTWQPASNALRCVFTDNCQSAYRSRYELVHVSLTGCCVTRLCTYFPRMFQVIRTNWMINPAGLVLLDDVQSCFDCDRKVEGAGCAFKDCELSRSMCDPCVLGPNNSPAQVTKVTSSKVEIPKNDAFAPMSSSNNFDSDRCIFFFDKRTRRFVVMRPRVWLFGRSEGMVAKQMFSVFFVHFCAVRPVTREFQPTCMPPHDAYGPSREIVVERHFVDFLLTTKKTKKKTMASKREVLHKAACTVFLCFTHKSTCTKVLVSALLGLGKRSDHPPH